MKDKLSENIVSELSKKLDTSPTIISDVFSEISKGIQEEVSISSVYLISTLHCRICKKMHVFTRRSDEQGPEFRHHTLCKPCFNETLEEYNEKKPDFSFEDYLMGKLVAEKLDSF